MVLQELGSRNESEQNPLIRAVVRFEDGTERSVVGRPLGKMTLSLDGGINSDSSFPIEVPDPHRLKHGLLITQTDVVEFLIEGNPREDGFVPFGVRKRPDIAVISFEKIW